MRGLQRSLCLVLLLVMVGAGYGQVDEVMPNKVIFKVKDEYRNYCFSDTIMIPTLNATAASLQMVGLEKRFSWLEGIKQLDRKQSPYPVEKMVDLSLIYEMTFDGEFSPFKAAKMLENTGFLEYAEPWFIPVASVVPNDDRLGGMWHLPIINAFEAWDIDTGSSDVIIAIVDTGVDKDHPDIVDNLWVNEGEIPGNGEDDDSNGFVDDFQGWNFYDNNNNIDELGFSHGTHVAGLAGATANNAYGVAGTGWACRIMAIKAGDKLQLPFGYDGIVYAAVNGAQVINCSWGSFGSSQFAHDIVKFATFNHDALLLGGAGNDNRENLFFPASYREVLSVGGSDTNDAKSGFSNYNYFVDLIAPGTLIFSLKNDTFGFDSGTSMSAPIAAGVAGLVRSKYPDLSALQVREQLRVSADHSVYDLPQNSAFQDKLGTGRLDMLKAIEGVVSPAVRVDYHEFSDGDDQVYTDGEEVSLGIELVNYLIPVNDLTVTVQAVSDVIAVTEGTWEISSLAQNGRLNNLLNPFKIKVLATEDYDEVAVVKVVVTNASGNYRLEEFLSFVVNPSYVNVVVNDVRTTVTQHGLVGFTDLFQTNGLGFQVGTRGNFLYEAGLMIGHKNEIRERVVDRVRGPELYDRDFWQQAVIRREVPTGEEAYLAQGSFTDTSANWDEIGLVVEQRVTAYNDPGHRNYVVVEYTVNNVSGQDLSGLAVGMFADWDIANATTNKAFTAVGKRFGYVMNVGQEKLSAGIQVLGPFAFNSYMIDNVTGGYGGIDMYDDEDFSSRRKYKSLTENRLEAGMSNPTGQGNDVIQVVSVKDIDLAANESVTVPFVLHGAISDAAVLQSADSAYRRYYGYGPGENVEKDFVLQPLYPNPTDGVLNLDLDVRGNRTLMLYLYNIQGVLVRTYETQPLYAGFNGVDLTLPPLAPGSYYLVIKSGEQTEITPFILVRE